MSEQSVSPGGYVQEQDRLDLIRQIEKKRGSRVIAYVTGTRPGHWDSMDYEDVRILQHHLETIFQNASPPKLDLFLYTPGGYAEVPTAIVALIREYLGPKGEFSVLIPAMAFSAGTVVSLGADKIIMGPGGHIGPIDTQMGGQSVDTLRAYFDLANSLGLRSRSEIRNIFLKMTDKISPLLFGSMQKVSKESERKALRVLSTRRRPLSKKQNRKIVRFLTHEVGIHGQAIHRTEALDNGLEFVRKAEHYGIRDEMSELFAAYEQLLELDLPLARKSFNFQLPGDANDVDVDGNHTMTKPLSLVESRDRLDIAKFAYGFRFWRDAPVAPIGEPAPQVSEPQVSEFGTRAFAGLHQAEARASASYSSSASGSKADSALTWQVVRRECGE